MKEIGPVMGFPSPGGTESLQGSFRPPPCPWRQWDHTELEPARHCPFRATGPVANQLLWIVVLALGKQRDELPLCRIKRNILDKEPEE